MLLQKSLLISFALLSYQIVSGLVIKDAEEVSKAFINHELVPDILNESPLAFLSVIFPSGLEVNLGEEVALSDISESPTLSWEADDSEYYTLIMTDPDAPSRVDPFGREHRHWLVVNIPGTRIEEGTTLTSFLPSHPQPDTGLHRYAFLVYQQTGYLEFEESLDDNFGDARGNFSTNNFVEKHGFNYPAVAGNFYQTQNI